MTAPFTADVDPADYDVAREFLSLLFPTGPRAAATVRALEIDGKTIDYLPGLVLNAAGRDLLPRTDKTVGQLLIRAMACNNGERKAKPITPPLMVRGEPLMILVGYERVCCAYHLDPTVKIPCRVI